MSIGKAVFLGFIQGLTEFLPISSSGHLVIFQKILGFENPPVFFDVLAHLGTLFALLIFLRKKFWILRSKRIVFLLFLGTLPAGFFGLLLRSFLDQIFNSFILVGFSYLFTAFILFFFGRKGGKKKIGDLSFFDALFIGFFQALALFPGVSRSGMTISAGLLRKLKSDSAFDFSFFLAILAIFGAFLLQLPLLCSLPKEETCAGFLGMVVSGLTGYWSLNLLKNFLQRGRFFWFGVYCLFLGLVILLLI